MRQIHRASLVFRLRDILTKGPVTNAIILFNGATIKHIRKNDGYYVFSNVNPGAYNIKIIATGYLDLNFTVYLQEYEVKVMNFGMAYKVNSPVLINSPRFEITVNDGGIPSVDTDITLKIKNNLDYLKLLNPIEKETYMATLTSDFNSVFIDQDYIYKITGEPKLEEEVKEDENKSEDTEKAGDDNDSNNDNRNKKENNENLNYDNHTKKGENVAESKPSDDSPDKNISVIGKEYNLFFDGFDAEKKSYTLREPAEDKIGVEGEFTPYWKLKTDSKGRLIFPFLSQFMKENKIKFELQSLGKKSNFIGDVSKIENKIIYVSAELK